MKQFLRKMVLFFILFIVVSQVVRWLLPRDYYWGNTQYDSKIAVYAKASVKPYNTVFFGSSRILTGIEPSLFDSLMNLGGTNNRYSFNLASVGTWFNESYYLYDRFLDDPELHANIDLVLMEFQNVMSINWDKISSDKVVYYQDAANLKFVMNYSSDQSGGLVKKTAKSVNYIATYSIAYFQNLLNIGKSDLLFSIHPPDTVENRGFRKMYYDPELVEADEIKEYVDNSEKYLTRIDADLNESHFKKAIEMIERSKKMNIKLIFILPPVKLTEGMIGVYHKLPKEHKMEVNDSRRYPDLYNPYHWSDHTHFNTKGAALFTRYVVENLRSKGLTKLNINQGH